MVNYITSLPSPEWEKYFPRTVSILGSTGSIGTNALNVIQSHKKLFHIVALAGGKNFTLLAKQAIQWRPNYLAIQDENSKKALISLLPNDYKPKIFVGQQGYVELASLPEVTTVLSAQVGAAGLYGTIAAAKEGKIICLANKETLVLAGKLIQKLCFQSGAVILPVDSEHNAIFQALYTRNPDTVRNIILTASGGPFRNKKYEFLKNVTPEQAINHPNWKMGTKISVDSATMINKGLEVIEAHYLYGLPSEQIKIVVHPQSYVHSFVEFTDNSLMAHLGTADMRMPIAHCLAWPNYLNVGVEPFTLSKIGPLTFEEPDLDSFPCVSLAREALISGPSAQIILNAANEIAVDAFLKKQIGFMDIPILISKALEADSTPEPTTLESIEALDQQTRYTVTHWIEVH